MGTEDRWQSLADRLIEEAMQRGEFDYSALKGKPLDDGTTDAATDWHAGEQLMGNKVLANSGHVPPFLTKKRDIETMISRERTLLLRDARRHKRLQAEALRRPPHERASLREQADAEWQRAIQRFADTIGPINAEIHLFNLMNKIPSLHMPRITLEGTLERVRDELAREAFS